MCQKATSFEVTVSNSTSIIPSVIQHFCSITNSMEQSPLSDAKGPLASQEILCLLWYSKVHYCFHKILPLVHLPGQMNLVHPFTSSVLDPF